MSLIIRALVSLVDPIGMVGWITAGVVARIWWQAAVGAAAWAVFLSIVSAVAFRNVQPIRINGDVLVSWAVGFSLAALVVFGIKRSVQKRRLARN
jgi:hypothetical protein